jgi:16S rRNA (uracil1498-N3)-methyltransferase
VSALHRFFVDDLDAPLSGDQARQIAEVLRLAPGARIVLVKDGEEAELELRRVTRAAVEGSVVERRPARGEPRARITLALPVLRGDRSEEVVEAVTQLGVSRIVPLVSERSVVRELSDKKKERWQRIARESAETARRGRIPEIAPLAAWSELFERLAPPILVAWEEEPQLPLRMAIPDGAGALSMVIGPEGGLSFEEVAIARSHGATTVSLGPRNLRSETAAVAAVAQLVGVLETI